MLDKPTRLYSSCTWAPTGMEMFFKMLRARCSRLFSPTSRVEEYLTVQARIALVIREREIIITSIAT
jgi:hypothetical protein